jgi:TorA maturation chaperone TorD
LHESNAETIARAVAELGLPSADPDELALAYADVFLLNVFPYGTVFADPESELNGPGAQQVAALYETHDYGPPELTSAGAADHLGLCLGFLPLEQDAILPYMIDWAPVCCLAVEREPSASPFHRALARVTREKLLTLATSYRTLPVNNQLPITNNIAEEISLRDLIRFFLAPARCGVYFSRSKLGQMGKALGVRLPFGSRFDVAEMLFASAGDEGQVEKLIDALSAESESWALEYRGWAEMYPVWKPYAETWLARTADTRRTLTGMKQIVELERA